MEALREILNNQTSIERVVFEPSQLKKWMLSVNEDILMVGLMNGQNGDVEWYLSKDRIQVKNEESIELSNLLGIKSEDGHILAVRKDRTALYLNKEPYKHSAEILKVLLLVLRVLESGKGYKYCRDQALLKSGFEGIVESINRYKIHRLTLGLKCQDSQSLIGRVNQHFNRSFIMDDVIAIYDDSLIGSGSSGLIITVDGLVSFRRSGAYILSNDELMDIELSKETNSIKLACQELKFLSKEESEAFYQIISLKMNYLMKGGVEEPWHIPRVKKPSITKLTS